MNRCASVSNPISAMTAVALIFLCFTTTLAAAVAGNSGEISEATGAAIQAYHDNYSPQVFSPPARGWLYADITILVFCVTSGSWLVLRHKPAHWLTVQLAVALLYFGLFRGGCLCPIGATSNVAIGLVQPELIGRAELAIFLIPLAAALFCGRVFCSSACPLGAIQHLIAPRKCRSLPLWLHRLLLAVPVLLLITTIWSALMSPIFLICRLDPYVPIFFQGHAWAQKFTSYITTQFTEPGVIVAASLSAWIFLVVALLLGWLIPRVFCRYVCPYGVLLGLLSVVASRRRQINPDTCACCRKCERECPVQAISISPERRYAALSAYQCIQCNRCASACPQRSVQTTV